MGGLHSKLSKADRSFKATPRKVAPAADDSSSSLEIDPRSPNIFRTPITNSSVPTSKRTDDMCPRNILKSRFQGEYEIGTAVTADPRSPSTFIVRTPICLKTSNQMARNSDVVECTMDDSVPVVESIDDGHQEQKQVVADEAVNSEDEESICNVSTETVISTIDPRSPSLNIDRTPFFFANKPTVVEETPSAEVAATDVASVDKVDTESSTTAVAELNVQTISNMIKTFIFEDNENNYCTPPKKMCEKSMLADAQQRTPLSCLANRKNAIATRTALSSSAKTFDGFAKNGSVFSSTRMEVLDENSTRTGSTGDNFSKEKVF